MVARGRMGRSCGDAHYSRLDPARVPRGVQKRQAKVNEDAVREMRQRHAAGERLCDIAAAFRIAQATAHQIVHRRSWRHVE
jgi:hypothetical protein